MAAQPRLPQPLTPESLNGLMRERAYWDATHPRFPTYQRLVKRGFEILYPGPERRDDTGIAINTPPRPPEQVAHLVEQTNREMKDVEEGFNERPSPGGDGMVHVQPHVREGGKVEVSDHWRAAPGQGAGQSDATNDGGGKSAPQSQGDSEGDAGEDNLQGQSGEDTLSAPNTPGEPPKDAFVAPKPDKLVREWTGTWQARNEKEKYECVGLVKKAIPEIGATPTWREGEKIIGPENPPLKPGTAIATFNKDGKYPSLPTGNHAGIFLGYGTKDGQDGIWVFDQDRKREADKRFISFNRPGAAPINRAESYSVIRKRN